MRADRTKHCCAVAFGLALAIVTERGFGSILLSGYRSSWSATSTQPHPKKGIFHLPVRQVLSQRRRVKYEVPV